MKIKLLLKYIIIILIGLNIGSCGKKTKKINKDFVYLKGNKFKLNNKKYFPLMLNYIVVFREIEDSVVISAPKYYEKLNEYESHNLKENTTQLNAHLQLINEMGFNTIRLVVLDRMRKDKTGFYYNSEKKIHIKTQQNKLINALKVYLNVVKKHNLKVMLLMENMINEPSIELFNTAILEKFRNEPTIFAYDFFNEPLYFDNENNKAVHRTKESAFEIVTDWRNMMDKHAPYQLFTIGFSEPTEVFEWDPSILPVDFISFHTYHPLRVPNEIYWYSKFAKKPWMIGETALPADNDSVSYEHQKTFTKDVYQRVIDCGGAGLGWWEFQEFPNFTFEASFTGILNHEGITKTKEGNYSIIGTVKPMVKEIANFKNYKKKECKTKPNYYNMLGYNNYVTRGKIINKRTNKPIEGAVIRACNKWWSICQNTFTNKDGEFTIYSNDKIARFYFSAPGMSYITALNDTLKYTLVNKSEKYNIKKLPNTTLEYHKISYVPFLNNDTNVTEYSLFKFNENMFNNAKFETYYGVVELDELDFLNPWYHFNL